MTFFDYTENNYRNAYNDLVSNQDGRNFVVHY
jgi:hypothetical protein